MGMIMKVRLERRISIIISFYVFLVDHRWKQFKLQFIKGMQEVLFLKNSDSVDVFFYTYLTIDLKARIMASDTYQSRLRIFCTIIGMFVMMYFLGRFWQIFTFSVQVFL